MAQDTIDRLLHDIPECASGRALKECETLGLGIIGSDRAGESFPNHPILALPRIRLLDVVLGGYPRLVAGTRRRPKASRQVHDVLLRRTEVLQVSLSLFLRALFSDDH